jgi:DNA-binding CsgD family transcriptional regulator
MPEVLSTRHLRAMLDLVGDGYDDDPAEGLPGAVIQGLMRLVPCDAISLFEFDPARRHCGGEACLHEPDLSPVFWEHYASYPPCSYPELNGDTTTVTKTSDFYTPRQWHSSPMYSDCLRRSGVEDEIVACLPVPAGRTARLLLRRASGTFRERDKLLVALLRPHLRDLYQRRKHEARAPQLTPRQQELLGLVAAGYSNTDIARQLHLSPNTVRKHLENIYQRLDVSSRTAAVARAFRHQHFTRR